MFLKFHYVLSQTLSFTRIMSKSCPPKVNTSPCLLSTQSQLYFSFRGSKKRLKRHSGTRYPQSNGFRMTPDVIPLFFFSSAGKFRISKKSFPMTSGVSPKGLFWCHVYIFSFLHLRLFRNTHFEFSGFRQRG